jgi:DNA-binding GntR family transcriptional regulator
MATNDKSETLHARIANSLRERIYNHEWKANEQIPTEMQLVEEYGASRGTIKKAISVLVTEGLLVQTPGRGTFVVEQSITHPTGGALLSFGESLRAQGIPYETKVLRQETGTADDYAASKLSIPVGSPVLYLNRVRYVKQEPTIYIESIINLAVCPKLKDLDFSGNKTLFGAVEQYSSQRIGYSHAQYAAMVAGEERGRILEVDPSSPVLHLTQLIFMANNVPFEWSSVWLRANRYVVGAVLQRV